MLIADALRLRRAQLSLEADLCSTALREARGLATSCAFGPMLGRLLARACDMLDRIDDVLIGLSPGRDCDAFVRAAALHRELEQIQSMVPREHRRLQRALSA